MQIQIYIEGMKENQNIKKIILKNNNWFNSWYFSYFLFSNLRKSIKDKKIKKIIVGANLKNNKFLK